MTINKFEHRENSSAIYVNGIMVIIGLIYAISEWSNSEDPSDKFFGIIVAIWFFGRVLKTLFLEKIWQSEIDFNGRRIIVYRYIRGELSSTQVYGVGDIRSITWMGDVVYINLFGGISLNYHVSSRQQNQTAKNIAKELGAIFQLPSDKVREIDMSAP